MSNYRSEILKLAESTLLTNEEIARIVGCSERTVRLYAGSYVARCKAKTAKENVDPFQIQKVVLLPDIHYPHYEQRVMDAIDEFIIDYEPNELVYMGDQISLDCISFWNKRKPLLKEGQRLLNDFEGFNEQVLLNHEKLTDENTKRTFNR